MNAAHWHNNAFLLDKTGVNLYTFYACYQNDTTKGSNSYEKNIPTE
jgi:hypothetical protein